MKSARIWDVVGTLHDLLVCLTSFSRNHSRIQHGVKHRDRRDQSSIHTVLLGSRPTLNVNESGDVKQALVVVLSIITTTKFLDDTIWSRTDPPRDGRMVNGRHRGTHSWSAASAWDADSVLTLLPVPVSRVWMLIW